MTLPDSAVVGNIWFQGENTEISAVTVSEKDSTSSIVSAAYVFNATSRSTASKVETTAKNSFLPGQKNIYGIEWKRNGDVDIYVNGKLVNSMAGSEWNPNGMLLYN